jgi:sterol desaturase/sphingolipid hydroxylase (fatty acid hydroxylase superfamily)
VSKLEYYLDFVSMPFLMALLCLFTTINPLLVLAGFLLWSPLEYAIHRVVFHHAPYLKISHQEHHDKPSGKTGYSSFHSLAIFLTLVAVLPSSLVLGIAAAYWCYICLHHAIHHWKISVDSVLYPTKIRHHMHHHGREVNFGVTTPFWDHVFDTFESHEARKR